MANKIDQECISSSISTSARQDALYGGHISISFHEVESELYLCPSSETAAESLGSYAHIDKAVRITVPWRFKWPFDSSNKFEYCSDTAFQVRILEAMVLRENGWVWRGSRLRTNSLPNWIATSKWDLALVTDERVRGTHVYRAETTVKYWGCDGGIGEGAVREIEDLYPRLRQPCCT